MKCLMLGLCLCLGASWGLATDLNAGNVAFGKYHDAYRECYDAINQLEYAANDLGAKNKRFFDGEIKYNNKIKKSGKAGTASSKQAKKLSKIFKSSHLEFNKIVKKYQSKCKKVEKMIKSGVVYGKD